MPNLQAGLKELFIRIYNNTLFRNTFVLAGGTVVAQLIPILLQPVLRRIYSPEQFGEFSLYLSLIGILSIVSTFRYDNAIVLPRHDREAAGLVSLSMLISMLTAIVFMTIFLLFHDRIALALHLTKGNHLMLFLVPFSVFQFSWIQIMNFWLIRKSAFAQSSLNKMTRRGAEGVAQLTTGALQYPAGLMAGDLIGGFAGGIAATYRAFRSGLSLQLLHLQPLKEAIVKYRDFPIFNLIPTLLSAVGFQLPVFLMNHYFSREMVGIFDLSRQVLNLPLALLGITISQVLLQNLAEKKNQSQPVISQMKGILIFLFLFIAIEIFVIQLFGPGLFGWAFGDPWRTSGEVSKLLVINFSLNFLMSSVTAVFTAFRRIKLYSIWQVSYFIAITSLVFLSEPTLNAFLRTYVIIDSVMLILGILLAIKVIASYEKQRRPEN